MEHPAASIVLIRKQTYLRGEFAGGGKAHVPERMRREDAPARRALDEALLDQERLDDFLDGVARLRQGRRERRFVTGLGSRLHMLRLMLRRTTWTRKMVPPTA